jgi:hypothetical protein
VDKTGIRTSEPAYSHLCWRALRSKSVNIARDGFGTSGQKKSSYEFGNYFQHLPDSSEWFLSYNCVAGDVTQ